jgi:hypothetical protein
MKKLWFFCRRVLGTIILSCVWFSGFGQGTTPNPPNTFKDGDEILSHMHSMDMSYQDISSYAQWYMDSMPGDNVEEPINLTNTTPPARIIQVQDAMLELTESLTNLKVYPNPATDYVNFEYELPEYVENTTVVITTMTGKVVKQFDLKDTKGQILWDTRQVENGIYFYALKQGENTLVSGKVSILK